jgi:Leucine-rich repeat (LRR) protein
MTIETTEDAPAERSPWYAPSYALVLLATLGLQVGLYLSQFFGGVGKGQAVLIAVAATATLPLWFIACRLFRLRTASRPQLAEEIPWGRLLCGTGGNRIRRAGERRRAHTAPRVHDSAITLPARDAGHRRRARKPPRGLKNLRSLDLTGTKITDSGLANLRKLTNLQTRTILVLSVLRTFELGAVFWST